MQSLLLDNCSTYDLSALRQKNTAPRRRIEPRPYAGPRQFYLEKSHDFSKADFFCSQIP